MRQAGFILALLVPGSWFWSLISYLTSHISIRVMASIEDLSPREASRGYDCISIRDYFLLLPFYFYLFTLSFILARRAPHHQSSPPRRRGGTECRGGLEWYCFKKCYPKFATSGFCFVLLSWHKRTKKSRLQRKNQPLAWISIFINAKCGGVIFS